MRVNLIRPAGPISVEQLAAVEKQLGVTLPADYRGFMLHYNGGRPEPAGFIIQWQPEQVCGEDWRTSQVGRFLSIHGEKKANFLRYNTVDFAGRIPRDTVAIAYDPGGNLLLLACDGPYAGKVLFWIKDREVEEGRTPDYDNVGLVADSFQDLIDNRLH